MVGLITKGARMLKVIKQWSDEPKHSLTETSSKGVETVEKIKSKIVWDAGRVGTRTLCDKKWLRDQTAKGKSCNEMPRSVQEISGQLKSPQMT